ncbi:hypothetical protein KKA15_03425 [Patescibacteria group bacterium]|nr:hypothetical protein [Patescibacteria group bacterium]
MDNKVKNKIGLKSFLIIVLVIIISIPLFVIGFILFGSIAENIIVESILAGVLALIAFHLTLSILKKKFVPEDAVDVSKRLAIISGGIYIAYFIFFRNLDIILEGVIYTAIAFFYTRFFILKSFKK